MTVKESTREKRGKGIRRKVTSHAKLPGNWKDFLRDSNITTKVNSLLFKISQFIFPSNKAVYVTSGHSVINVSTTSGMMNCNHEEADTRVIVQILHALNQGMRSIKVRTVDTESLLSFLLVLSLIYYRINLR